jgi:dTDP-4-amino-4,6-dideoxygalactose transaminase
VFADVDPETLILDPAKIEPALSGRTRALIVVHLWGIPAPMPQIMKLASRYGLKVVEDCAQANGALIGGRPIGTFGDACCYSLQQSKQITCGEGGIFATSSAEAYERAVLYSNCGIPNFRFGLSSPERSVSPAESIGRGHLRFGHNHRISELQAAVALAQLSRIDSLLRRRAELTDLIEKELSRLSKGSARAVRTPSDCTISYWRYPILVPPGRGNYREIPYLDPVFQRISNDRQTPFGMRVPRHIRYERGICPNAEIGASQVRSMPVNLSVTEKDIIARVGELVADL